MSTLSPTAQPSSASSAIPAAQPVAPPTSAQIVVTLRRLGIPVANPSKAATWAGTEVAAPFTQDFIIEQQSTWRTPKRASPTLPAARAALPARLEHPTPSDLWLVASPFARPGVRLRVARQMLGWSQSVLAYQCGQQQTSLLNQFERCRRPTLPFVPLACRALDVAEAWVLDGDQTAAPPWLLPWVRATEEAHQFTDVLAARSDISWFEIMNDHQPHLALARWIAEPGEVRPREQPWWPESGSLLPWFAEAMASYWYDRSETMTISERAHHTLNQVVARWVLLEAHVSLNPGLAKAIPATIARFTSGDIKALIDTFGASQVLTSLTAKDTRAAPTMTEALNAMAEGMIPSGGAPILSPQGYPQIRLPLQVALPVSPPIPLPSRRGRPRKTDKRQG